MSDQHKCDKCGLTAQSDAQYIWLRFNIVKGEETKVYLCDYHLDELATETKDLLLAIRSAHKPATVSVAVSVGKI